MNAASLQWESAAVIAATGGRAIGDAWMARGVAIDSRQVRAGDLFVALRGDRFDGHDFLAVAAQKGAVAALVEVAPAYDVSDITALAAATLVFEYLALLAGRRA